MIYYKSHIRLKTNTQQISKKHFLKLSVLFLLLYCSIPISAQDFIVVSGKITDSKTMKPVDFATVYVWRQTIGVITNELGEFQLNIPKQYEHDSICFSCMGYEKLVKPIKKYNSKSNFYHISLNPSIFSLGEVKISAKKKTVRAKEVVQKAIENISTNYPDRPFMLHGYYRDYLKKDSDYVKLIRSGC